MTPRPLDTGLPPRQPRPRSTPTGLDVPRWAGRRATAALEAVRARGSRLNLPCVICGQRINYALRHPDPDACTVQHVKPQSTHPELTWDPRNHEPAHHSCNVQDQAKGTVHTDLGLTSL